VALFLIHYIICPQGLQWYQLVLIVISVAFLLLLLLFLYLFWHGRQGKCRRSGEQVVGDMDCRCEWASSSTEQVWAQDTKSQNTIHVETEQLRNPSAESQIREPKTGNT
jgi:hypothetical protein